MVAHGQDAQVTTIDHVHQTARGINAPTPRALQFPFERLRLTEARERGTHRITYQRVDASERPPALGLPIQIVVPRILGPTQHRSLPNQIVRGGTTGTHLGHSTADLVEQSGILIDAQRFHEQLVIVGAHHHHVVV